MIHAYRKSHDILSTRQVSPEKRGTASLSRNHNRTFQKCYLRFPVCDPEGLPRSGPFTSRSLAAIHNPVLRHESLEGLSGFVPIAGDDFFRRPFQDFRLRHRFERFGQLGSRIHKSALAVDPLDQR